MPIDGTWYNELGSVMNLVSNGTAVSGMYDTGVGDASGHYALTGYVDNDENPAVGWIVLWKNQAGGDSNSLTVWAGQYFPSDDPAKEALIAVWLLRREAPDEDDNWKATLVGQDTFGRVKGQPPAVQDIAALRPPAHPVIRPL
jgi:hypothetical protein